MKAKTKYLAVWIALLVPFSMFLLVTVDYAVQGANYGPGVLTVSAFFTLMFGLPAFYFFVKWRVERTAEDKLEKVAELLRSYGRITIEDAAKRLGYGEVETESLILAALSHNLVTGFVDPNTHQFYYGIPTPTYQAVVAPPTVVQVPIEAPQPTPLPRSETRFCRECGARVEWLQDQGRWHCPKCGNYQT